MTTTLSIVAALTALSELVGIGWMTSKRTYWPAYRVQRLILAAALGYAAATMRPGGHPSVGVWAGFFAALLVASLWANWLIWHRNRHPRYIVEEN